jgi:carboxymethylenebutenolidase
MTRTTLRAHYEPTRQEAPMRTALIATALTLGVAATAAVPVACAQDHPAESATAASLSDSPRHHEWVQVPAGEGRTVRSFVAYPERSGKSLAVIVIHENRGLTDWVRSFADQLAAAGYIAVAPDLLSGFDAQHAGTDAFADSDAAREAIYQLDEDQVTRDLLAVQTYARKIPAATGKTAVIGFCWGGSQSFRFATNAPDLSAALVFYGTAPEDEARIEAISAPVYGFYGERDERVNATIPETRERMTRRGKSYEAQVYGGAGHAFMRQGDDPDAAAELRAAHDRAWERVQRILSGIE